MVKKRQQQVTYGEEISNWFTNIVTMTIGNLADLDFLTQSTHPKANLIAIAEGEPRKSTLCWKLIWHKIDGYSLGEDLDPDDNGTGLMAYARTDLRKSKLSPMLTTRKCSFCKAKRRRN